MDQQSPVSAPGALHPEAGGRAWLEVPYADKDAAKAAGARWDPDGRCWFAPAGITQALAAWKPRGPIPELLPGEDRTFGGGLFVDPVPTSCWFTNARTDDDLRPAVLGPNPTAVDDLGAESGGDRRRLPGCGGRHPPGSRLVPGAGLLADGRITAMIVYLHRSGKRPDDTWDLIGEAFEPMVQRGRELARA